MLFRLLLLSTVTHSLCRDRLWCVEECTIPVSCHKSLLPRKMLVLLSVGPFVHMKGEEGLLFAIYFNNTN